MDSMIEVLRFMVHYGLHFALPFSIAKRWGGEHWRKCLIILWATMLVDLDHLLASPMFDPCRCSIGYHPLHSLWAVGVYVLFLLFPKTRWWGVGLVLHMLTDAQDCLWIQNNC